MYEKFRHKVLFLQFLLIILVLFFFFIIPSATRVERETSVPIFSAFSLNYLRFIICPIFSLDYYLFSRRLSYFLSFWLLQRIEEKLQRKVAIFLYFLLTIIVLIFASLFQYFCGPFRINWLLFCHSVCYRCYTRNFNKKFVFFLAIRVNYLRFIICLIFSIDLYLFTRRLSSFLQFSLLQGSEEKFQHKVVFSLNNLAF